MKNGIPANETLFTPGAKRNRITYRFVTDDGQTLSRCTVRLGDTDPLTGEEITDVEFFREYYRTVDREIHRTIRGMRPEYTEEQKAWRRQEAKAYATAFEKDYG